jgi:hypothetical protein
MNFSINTSTTALIEEMEKIQNYVSTPVKTYTDLSGATILSQESIVSEEYIFKKAAEIYPEKNEESMTMKSSSISEANCDLVYENKPLWHASQRIIKQP